MTPLEQYNQQIKNLDELHKSQKKQSYDLLQQSQKNCKHKFGGLYQIGWFPDVAIMGYSCELCGFEKVKK